MGDRVDAFMRVRDLPYRLTGENPVTCLMKCHDLKARLACIGVESELAIGRFRWTALPIPHDILGLLAAAEENHVFLRVQIPETGTWVDVDPTWDSALAAVFDIAVWDGVNSTLLMAPLSDVRTLEISPASLRVKPLHVRAKIPPHDPNFGFYRAMDAWLEGVRGETVQKRV